MNELLNNWPPSVLFIGILLIVLSFGLYLSRYWIGSAAKRLSGRNSDNSLNDGNTQMVNTSVHSQYWKGIDLDARRQVTDPVADEVIRKIISGGEENIVNTVFTSLTRNDSLPPGLPAEVMDYFKATQQLPSWADNDAGREMLRKGELVYSMHGPVIAMLLLFKSLPECYSCAHGARVLYETGRLLETPGNNKTQSLDTLKRRVMETAQYVVNVMAPGGLNPDGDGKGIRSSQKVRLIHAAIRYFLNNREQGWDSSQYGKPINQEDMAGTLMSFSALIIEGLRTLDIGLSPDEEAAYFYCWRVAGHYMGVDPDLIPENLNEGLILGHQILNRNKAASEEGRDLTKACIDFTEDIIPFHTMDGMVEDLMRFLIGDEVSDVLGIKEFENKTAERMPEHLQWLLSEEEKLLSKIPLLQRIGSVAGRLLMQGFLVHYNDGKRITFYIPESLKQDWNLSEATDQNSK